MTDNITVKDPYLTPELAQRCRDELNSLKDKYVWAINRFVWGAGLFEESPGCYYITNVDPKTRDDIISDIKDNHGIQLPDSVIVMYYMGENLSEVHWHKDYTYDWAISIYLNQEWEESWGGIFEYCTDELITDDSDVHQVLPIFNRGVEQRGQINHRVSTTTQDAIVRESIQIFVPLDPEMSNEKDKAMYHYQSIENTF